MKLPHFTQHGSRTTGDTLDLFGDETALLEKLFINWRSTTPDRSMGDNVVTAKWDHGTIGKLVLEHTAVRLAASEDVTRVLVESGKVSEASSLTEENEAVRPLLDQMYDSARGVQPISVAITPSFIEAMSDLFDLLGPALGRARLSRTMATLTAALGSERRRAPQREIHPQARTGTPRSARTLVRPDPRPAASPCCRGPSSGFSMGRKPARRPKAGAPLRP